MKFSKKMAAVLATTALLACVFTGCGDVSTVDPNGAITANSLTSYTVSYDNSESSDVYRAFYATKLAHVGAAVKFQITGEKETDKNGVMGYIWDLQKGSDGYIDFIIFGFRNNTGTPEFYVSKYWNVDADNLSAHNFGSSKTLTSATDANSSANALTYPIEYEIISLGKDLSSYVTATAEDDSTYSYTVYADIYPYYTGSENYGYGINASHIKDADSSNSASSGYVTCSTTELTTVYADGGSYIIDLYSEAPTTSVYPFATVVIPPEVTGYTAASGADTHTMAVYTNIYAGKTLNGTWNVTKTYTADEVVEE